jgi:DNA polymerase-3 subunit alpha
VTGDSHYTKDVDYGDHDVLLCIGLGKKLADENRIKFVPGQYAVKSAEEMGELGFPASSLRASVEIAEMCEAYELPRAGGFPQRKDAYAVLEGSAYDGLMKRLTPESDEVGEVEAAMGLGAQRQAIRPAPHAIEDDGPYFERLAHELNVIKELGFEDYFLIAHDITSYARESGMYWTWGRGSSVGSLVAYALGITNIDPVLHRLYFERFLNPERRNPPDIDIDFTDEDRPLIIEFIEKRYGAENVAHIATFGSLGPRQVLKDLVRVLGKSELALKTVLQALPYDPQMKTEDLLDDPNVVRSISHYLGRDVVDYMARFAGIPRHASVHAAGVVIDREPIAGKLPLLMPRGRPVKASQYVYEDLVGLGFEKFDVLGVRTLRTLKETAISAGVDLERIPLDDKKTYDMLSRGQTIGVFQLESFGYRKFLAEFRPRDFEDVMMANALYRPGPMKGGRGLGELIARRRGRKSVTYAHPSLEPILKPTFGIMVYQEQVMAVVRELAGWSLAEADMLRYAVGKKKVELLEELKAKFLKDCVKLGHAKDFATSIFEDIEFFGRYGWNKAHAAAYGMVTYVSAYLKANFPAAYFCAMLNSEESDPKHRTILAGEAARMGVRIARPHVNESSAKYRVVEDVRGDYVLAGLASVKFVGEKAVAAVVEARKSGNRFSSVEDFRSRVPPRICNIQAIKQLQALGAFKGLPELNSQVEVPF